MAAVASPAPSRQAALLGGFSAVAESVWMGFPQAADVLELVRTAAGRARSAPRGLHGIWRRELTVSEASIVLMASFLISAALGAVRQVLFNSQFGAGADASAFYAAIRLPDAVFSLIAGGALSSAMIPVLLATTREDGSQAAGRLSSLVLNSLLAALALVVLVGEATAPGFVRHVLAPGFDAATGDRTVALTRLMLVQPLILAAGSVATAVLNSRNRFLLTGASVATHNVGLIAGILATRVHPDLGIYGPALGVLAGAAMQAVILLPALARGDFRYRPAIDFGDPRLRQTVALLIPNGLAVGVAYSGFIVDTAFASKAGQAAALPAVQNAFMLVGLPIALLGQAVGQSAFPRLAAHADAAEWDRLVRTLLRSLGAATALALPALAGLILLGRPVIRVLFEHGRFGGAAGTLTYDVLAVYAIGLPAYVGVELLARTLIALRDTRTPLLTNTFQIAGRGTLMAVLVGSQGVVAIPIAFAVMAGAEALALGSVLALRLRSRLAAGPT